MSFNLGIVRNAWHFFFFFVEGFSSLTLILVLQSKLGRILKCSGISSAIRRKLDLKLIKSWLKESNTSPVGRKRLKVAGPPVIMAGSGVF